MSKLIDLTGNVYGKWTVVKKGETLHSPSGAAQATWICRCECGQIKQVYAAALMRGQSRSCGCSQKEYVHEHHVNRKHGDSEYPNGGKCKRLYRVWLGMRERCNNPGHNRYTSYGGRGIRICSEWNDYSTFREWAMKNGYDGDAPRGQCTIDRINVDGDYSPDNCRWVDMKTQRKNQRKRRIRTK